MSPIVLSRPGKAERGISKRGGPLAHRSALRYNSQLAEDPSKVAPKVNACRDCASMTGVLLGRCNTIVVHSRRGPIGFSRVQGSILMSLGRGEGYEVLHPGNVEFILRGY